MVTDLLVTCRGLGDNEVQENDASDDDDQQPHEPVDDVLGVIKQNGGIESKVTHGHSQGREQISHKETDVGILGTWVLIQVGELVLELSWNVLVSNTKDTQKKGEQDDQNCVEKEENSQIIDNVCKHRNNWTQSIEDSQEEESLYQSKDNDNDHQNL